MKKLISGLFAAFVLTFPGIVFGMQANAGDIDLEGHLDFVYRYSEADDGTNDDDQKQEWNGYDTLNLETAYISMSGPIGDNVNWEISYAFTLIGPYGASGSAGRGPLDNNDAEGSLLNARLDFELGESMEFSIGRFIPPTSMTWSTHKMKNLHTVNYPLVHGSGIAPYAYMHNVLRLPGYQTGVMFSAMVGPVEIMAGGFNGNQFLGGDYFGKVDYLLAGNDNTMDIDRNKGLLAKAAVSQGGLHFGGWYYAEEATASTEQISGTAPPTQRTMDGKAVRWGIESAYEGNNFLLAAEYISSAFKFEDNDVDDDLVQNGWYVLLGYRMQSFQVIARYDHVNYDTEEAFAASAAVDRGDYNEENATTAGINYFFNENITMGLDYTWRDLESYEPAINELALIIEMDLF